MKDLKNKFEKLYSRYNAKKTGYTKTIDSWFEEKKQAGIQLLKKVDECANELNDLFARPEFSDNDSVVAKKQIKLFKKLCKQLSDIVKPVWRQWVEAIVVAGLLVFVLRTYVFGLYHVPTGSAEKNILVGDRIWGNKTAYYFDDIKQGDFVIFDDPEFYYYEKGSFNHWWQKYVGFPVAMLGLPAGPDNWVKRVIGIPGDVIEGRIENGKTVVYRNGEKLDETAYVNPYPLIRLKKEVGFLDLDSIGPLGIPGFLRKMTKTGYYTYDPSKSFAEQPYYNMTKNDVITRGDGRPDLRLAYSPTYESEEIDVYEDWGIEVERRKSVDEFGPYTVPENHYWVMGDSRKNSRDSRFWGFLDKDHIHGRASFVIYSVDSEEALWLFELLKHPIDFWTSSLRWDRFLKNLK